MQILIIKLPAGEQISSLNYSIDSGEVLIGQDAACQIQLPDQRQRIARRHARLYQEGEQWYLESLGDNELSVNQTAVSGQRILLTDGDLITCGDYQLVISQFEPWLSSQKLRGQPPSLPSAEDTTSDYCVTPGEDDTQTRETINDPFDHSVANIKAPSPAREDFTDLSMSTTYQRTSPESDNPLIDVLAPQPETDHDWSIHRALRAGEANESETFRDSLAFCPVPVPVLSERVPTPNRHRKSLCYAMLDALEQTLDDLSPENLDARFSGHTAGRIQRYFGKKKHRTESSDFRRQYQHYHQKLMDDQSYRLLFLQRFRQAMKKQESDQ